MDLAVFLGSIRETGTLLNPTSGSLKKVPHWEGLYPHMSP